MAHSNHPLFRLTVAAAILTVAGCATTPPEATPLPETDATARTAPPPATSTETVALAEFDPNGQPFIPGTSRLVERTFYFEYDRSVLTPAALVALELHAQTLIAHPQHLVIVEGHADERGSREYNLALGERRADVVRAFLLAAGVSPRQIQTVSYGEERPAVTGSTESAWSDNRRAFLNYAGNAKQVGVR